MHPSRAFAPVTALFVLLAITAPSPPGRPDPLADSPELTAIKRLSRIRIHFDSVLSELESRDMSALNGAQRVRRTQIIHTLSAYRDRGVFPHNYDFPSRAMPYFVDRKTGALCAVANLLASTGRTDIVHRVARADNNVWVPQLAGDTAFSRWLDTNGLTLDEAARIQFPYMEEGPRPSMRNRPASPVLTVGAPIAVAGSVVAAVWNATANRDGHKRLGNLMGLASGILTTGLGTALLTQDQAPRAAGPAMMALGGLSLALASHSIFHHAGVVRAEREAARRLATAQASLAPFVTTDGSAGVGVQILF